MSSNGMPGPSSMTDSLTPPVPGFRDLETDIPAIGSVPDGVRRKIEHNLEQRTLVADDNGRGIRKFHRERHAAPVGILR